MTSPVVSVCIPVYNTERFILDAVRSVLSQSYQDFEIVIVDNASTDRTPALLATLDDPRIRVFHNERNIGAQGNFNRALSLAQGRYVKVLCADDVIYPSCLERQVAVLEADPERAIAIVGCARDIIDEHGRQWLRRGFPGAPARVPGSAAIAKTIRSGTNIFGEPAAVLARTADMTGAGGFDPRFGFCLDLDLWCRLLQHGDLYMLDDALCGFRISNQSWSAALAHRQQREFVEFVDDLERRGIPVSKADRALASSRAWINAVLRQAVTRVLLVRSRLSRTAASRAA